MITVIKTVRGKTLYKLTASQRDSMSNCNTFYAFLKMEISTRHTKKGHASSFPSTGAIHLNCLDAIAILLFIMTRKISREILDSRKMWTPMTETNNVCWDSNMNLIWPLAARHQLWATLQSSAAQLLSQPFKNFS